MFSYWREHSTLIVRIETELDQRAAAQIRRELDALLRDPMIRHLVLDFSGITFMDSSGIGLIIGRYKLLAKRGGAVSIRNADPRVSRIFEMSGVYRIVDRMA